MARTPQTTGASLSLPADVGISDVEIKTIQSEWGTLDRVNKKLAEWGMHNNPVPDVEYPPVTAEALMNPSGAAYTVVFAAQLRWYNYATRLLAEVRAAILEIENAMDDIATTRRSALRKLNDGIRRTEKLSAQDVTDMVNMDPNYRDLKLQLQPLEQMRIKLDAWTEGLDRSLKTVSRQIENRKTEFEGGRREGNMPAAANPQPKQPWNRGIKGNE